MSGHHQGEPSRKGTSASLLFWSALAIVALVAMLALGVYRRGSGMPSGADDPLVGASLAEVNLVPLTGDGKPVGLETLSGQVTLVNFWGTWCPPCQAEFPHLNQLRQELAAEKAFQLVAVSCDNKMEEDVDKVRSETVEFLAAQKSGMPTYHDPDLTTRKAFMMATGRSDFVYPTTLLFGPDRKIRGLWRGYSPGMERDVEKVVRSVLSEIAAAP